MKVDRVRRSFGGNLSGEFAFLFKKQFEMCKVNPGETVACVSDLAKRRDGRVTDPKMRAEHVAPAENGLAVRATRELTAAP
jgi:hypothetical protein